MDENMMWFGNRNYMQWIPCPQVGASYSISGSQQSSEYLDGGTFLRNSMNKTKSFGLTWSLTSRANIRGVTDYAEGVYGAGPIYWSDPMTMDTNVLAQAMATPSLGGYDAPPLNGNERPDLVPTSANSLGYPTESAVYSMASASDEPLRHYVPIPPGHTAWVGVHGAAGTGGAIYAQPTKGNNTSGSPVALTMLGVTTTTRVINAFNSGPNTDGIEVFLGGEGTITLTGIIVQVLPTGRTPEVGGFISGQGHSGCDWSSLPARDAYSRAMDLMGVSATLTETEQWR